MFPVFLNISYQFLIGLSFGEVRWYSLAKLCWTIIAGFVSWSHKTHCEPSQLTANQRFRYSDFVTDFVEVISSQSEGLGKMAPGIVKIYLGSPFSANRSCSRSVCSRSVWRVQLSWTHTLCFLSMQLPPWNYFHQFTKKSLTSLLSTLTFSENEKFLH